MMLVALDSSFQLGSKCGLGRWLGGAVEILELQRGCEQTRHHGMNESEELTLIAVYVHALAHACIAYQTSGCMW